MLQLKLLFFNQLGAEVGACAISHLEEVSEEGIQAMSKASIIGVLLPTTAYILKLKPPPARQMIEQGTIILEILLYSNKTAI